MGICKDGSQEAVFQDGGISKTICAFSQGAVPAARGWCRAENSILTGIMSRSNRAPRGAMAQANLKAPHLPLLAAPSGGRAYVPFISKS